MLPGVISPPSGLPKVLQGDLCAINLVENRAPVAIGLANMSTTEMLAAGMKGKGITTLHTYLDQLWAFGEKTHPPVIAHKHDDSEQVGDQEGEEKGEVVIETVSIENVTAMPSTERETPDLDNLCLNVETEPEAVTSLTEQASDCEVEALEIVHLTEMSKDAESQQDAAENVRTAQEQMDEVLLQCFLHALKCKVKKADLPLLASTFLKIHMYPCCPEGRTLDIKKSSYKKLSKFLHSMQQKQIIQVKEFSKGVESIVVVKWDHADLKSFIVPEIATGDEVMKVDRDTDIVYQPPEISSFYSVSSKLLPLFEHAGLKKDATLSSVDVRNIVTNYVKSNELIDDCNKNYVIVNPTLCDCILEKSEHHIVTKLKWDDLFARCLERLQECHQVTFPGQNPIIRKGSIKPIVIDVAQRASNKKVTLIKNLEVYGIDPQIIGNALQLRAQASVTLNQVPGTKDKMALQVQGNQVNHVAKLLTEEYRIPSKYIQGLNKAPKGGKKKR
ncbi:eukaryotic translation initiation factor 2D isoform X2 [Pristis pectinata]|nr:eukaryotic translation initiation factor 2D isoform X2 [Pristis pectinata]XP_051890753.1 eukaryotic translation initiation factor 2D isoform X2 [Pristis pectinata]XP_051890754.1 eukaryotic translation initiation factor 2D isoform X2 [Pristis pectinata]